MTRSEADILIQEYDEQNARVRLARRMGRSHEANELFHVMNACRERLIDALSGEERTEPLTGSGR